MINNEVIANEDNNNLNENNNLEENRNNFLDNYRDSILDDQIKLSQIIKRYLFY